MRISQEELKTWLGKKAAAAALNCSEKTIERKAAEGLIRKGNIQVPGRKPIPVFHPEDIDRLKAEVVDAELMVQTDSAIKLPARQNDSGAANSFLAMVAQSLNETMQQLPGKISAEVHLRDKLLLTTQEAIQLGFSRAWLRQALQDGKLTNYGSVNRQKFSRSDLERSIGAGK